MDRVIRIGGGWYAAMDKRRGRPYYFNKNSGEKRWNFPKGEASIPRLDLLNDSNSNRAVESSQSAIDTSRSRATAKSFSSISQTAVAADPRGESIGGGWYRTHDSKREKDFYFHPKTRRKQWKKPAIQEEDTLSPSGSIPASNIKRQELSEIGKSTTSLISYSGVSTQSSPPHSKTKGVPVLPAAPKLLQTPEVPAIRLNTSTPLLDQEGIEALNYVVDDSKQETTPRGSVTLAIAPVGEPDTKKTLKPSKREEKKNSEFKKKLNALEGLLFGKMEAPKDVQDRLFSNSVSSVPNPPSVSQIDTPPSLLSAVLTSPDNLSKRTKQESEARPVHSLSIQSPSLAAISSGQNASITKSKRQTNRTRKMIKNTLGKGGAKKRFGACLKGWPKVFIQEGLIIVILSLILHLLASAAYSGKLLGGVGALWVAVRLTLITISSLMLWRIYAQDAFSSSHHFYRYALIFPSLFLACSWASNLNTLNGDIDWKIGVKSVLTTFSALLFLFSTFLVPVNLQPFEEFASSSAHIPTLASLLLSLGISVAIGITPFYSEAGFAVLHLTYGFGVIFALFLAISAKRGWNIGDVQLSSAYLCVLGITLAPTVITTGYASLRTINFKGSREGSEGLVYLIYFYVCHAFSVFLLSKLSDIIEARHSRESFEIPKFVLQFFLEFAVATIFLDVDPFGGPYWAFLIIVGLVNTLVDTGYLDELWYNWSNRKRMRSHERKAVFLVKRYQLTRQKVFAESFASPTFVLMILFEFAVGWDSPLSFIAASSAANAPSRQAVGETVAGYFLLIVLSVVTGQVGLWLYRGRVKRAKKNAIESVAMDIEITKEISYAWNPTRKATTPTINGNSFRNMSISDYKQTSMTRQSSMPRRDSNATARRVLKAAPKFAQDYPMLAEGVGILNGDYFLHRNESHRPLLVIGALSAIAPLLALLMR